MEILSNTETPQRLCINLPIGIKLDPNEIMICVTKADPIYEQINESYLKNIMHPFSIQHSGQDPVNFNARVESFNKWIDNEDNDFFVVKFDINEDKHVISDFLLT